MVTIDSRANWLTVLPNQCTCIVIKLDHHSILSLDLLVCPYNDCLSDVPSPHFISSCRKCVARATFAHAAGLLYDDYDAITLGASVAGNVVVPCRYKSSPTFPCLFIRRFAIHSTTVAPELSIQLSIV